MFLKMEETKKVLYVCSEIFPYLPESDISAVGRYLPSGIQELGGGIRAFMPRYGLINERRNQLHEVIRLSGMNLVIDGADHPLVIKVSSIAAARMQVYFIDNEDYFHRKAIDCDAEGKFFSDNDERAIFFAHGVLETVKKLRWKPDVVHCIGWISHLVPVMLKKLYNNDPLFEDTKVVVSLFNDRSSEKFNEGLVSKLEASGLAGGDVEEAGGCDVASLAKLAVRYADGVIAGTEAISEEIRSYIEESGIPVAQFEAFDPSDPATVEAVDRFYEKIR